jgi:hypothetical protein
MMKRSLSLSVALALTLGACGGGDDDDQQTAEEQPRSEAGIVTPGNLGELSVGKALRIADSAATNPTAAHDPAGDVVYLAWTQEVPGQTVAKGEDPRLEAVVARSDDGGATFGAPVTVNDPAHDVYTRTVSPTQVQVGPDGTVYVLYQYAVESELSEHRGLRHMVVTRSEDRGQTWASGVEVATDEAEGVTTSRDMTTLFVAPDGDLYVSYLDGRESIEQAMKGETEHPEGHGEFDPTTLPQNQLRVVRSSDGGRTWSKSALVAKATCVCCGTVIGQGADGPVYAGTRSEWYELKGSKDAVRDPYLSSSADEGVTWSKATKIHDDNFKVSGCPDVAQGLAVDQDGRVHTAWYTGAESHPGVYYAVSEDQGKTFGPPVALLKDEWVPYGDVRLSLDEEGNAWVAFEDRRGDVDKIRVVRVAPDGAVDASTAFEGTIPAISARKGRATVTWQAVPGEDAGEDALTSVHAAVVNPAG